MTRALKKHHEYLFSGLIKEKNSYNNSVVFEMRVSEYEETCKTPSSGLVPIYGTTAKLGQKTLRTLINAALETTTITEYLPEDILSRFNLYSRAQAVKNIHNPVSALDFALSRKRLVFDELLCSQLALFHVKGAMRQPSNHVIKNTDIEPFIKSLPFAFTSAQQTVLAEIFSDITGKYAMNRLIQGDVGSGKTAVAMACAYCVIKNNFQAAIMAPTEILARQHYESFNGVFAPLGISSVLLTGSLKAASKRMAYEQILSGQARMIIGTHALIQENCVFNNLGLVITDEQHRFGVNQRFCLARKGNSCHVLVMSATPIPRTLALILYGDMDISVINCLPPGRLPIETYFVNSAYRVRIYNFIKTQISSGRQAYIVCPAIDAVDGSDIKAVEAHAAELSTVFSEFTVGFLHGRQKPEKKQRTVDGFVNNTVHILVSTTVIEVGVNVPNASIMLVENADRFGLAQLHQLRGRVGRGRHKSYCILMSDTASPASKSKLRAMAQTSDGFELSELDLKLRGPGDFFGVAQHGLPEFKIANLYQDLEILKQAQEAAQLLLGNETEEIHNEISRVFKFRSNEIIL
jgi:ATP-dependent DNA helicase RecG